MFFVSTCLLAAHETDKNIKGTKRTSHRMERKSLRRRERNMWKLIGNQLNVMWKFNSFGRQRVRDRHGNLLRGRIALVNMDMFQGIFCSRAIALTTSDVSIENNFFHSQLNPMLNTSFLAFNLTFCQLKVRRFSVKWNIRLITGYTTHHIAPLLWNSRKEWKKVADKQMKTEKSWIVKENVFITIIMSQFSVIILHPE